MNAQQIYGLQFVLSLVLYTLLARWYVAPRLAPLPLASALTPLLFLHASRYLGMVFLVPSVTGGPLPSEFASASSNVTSSTTSRDWWRARRPPA